MPHFIYHDYGTSFLMGFSYSLVPRLLLSHTNIERVKTVTRKNKERRSLINFDHVRDVDGRGFEECS